MYRNGRVDEVDVDVALADLHRVSIETCSAPTYHSGVR